VIKILFVIPSLGGGGAERACVNLLKHLNRSQFGLSLALFCKAGPYLSELPPDVVVFDLKTPNHWDSRLIWRLAQLLRKTQPDIVFSILRYTNVVTLLAARLARSEARILINEQNRLREEFAVFGGGWIKSIFVRHLYPWADGITVISQGIQQELIRDFDLPESKIQVIYNPVDVAAVQALSKLPVEHPWFLDNSEPIVVAAGRLHPQKGFEYLIRAFQRVVTAVPARLVILGEGPSRPHLEGLVMKLGLEDVVALPGFQQNPYSWMARAAAFVLSSLYEGFGNVIVEAMALGVPVVATRCPSGPDEIIDNEVNGLLVPVADETALAEAILRVLRDEKLAAKIRRHGPDRAAAFDVSRITAQYAALFESLCAS
jgi:glycosyltransferase involved in cell wall biosynthesis